MSNQYYTLKERMPQKILRHPVNEAISGAAPRFYRVSSIDTLAKDVTNFIERRLI